MTPDPPKKRDKDLSNAILAALAAQSGDIAVMKPRQTGKTTATQIVASAMRMGAIGTGCPTQLRRRRRPKLVNIYCHCCGARCRETTGWQLEGNHYLCPEHAIQPPAVEEEGDTPSTTDNP